MSLVIPFSVAGDVTLRMALIVEDGGREAEAVRRFERFMSEISLYIDDEVPPVPLDGVTELTSSTFRDTVISHIGEVILMASQAASIGCREVVSNALTSGMSGAMTDDPASDEALAVLLARASDDPAPLASSVISGFEAACFRNVAKLINSARFHDEAPTL